MLNTVFKNMLMMMMSR